MTGTNKRGKRTFQGILNNVACENAFRLIGRARTANRIAKALHGGPRERVYQVKAHALLGLTNRFPERIRITKDAHSPRFVLVKAPVFRFGLHAPAYLFETGTELAESGDPGWQRPFEASKMSVLAH